MCDRFGNTCSQRKKLKCEIDSGSQNNLDEWLIWEHIKTKNTNKFWLEKWRIKLIKLNQGLKLIDTAPSWLKSKWDRGETTNWWVCSN